MFPEWAKWEGAETEAIQHLRVDDLRDNINNIIFPYVTVATPTARTVSWLCLIYDLLFEELEMGKLTARQYDDLLQRYYSILATSDSIHAPDIEHLGPVGRDGIGPRILQIFEEHINEVDFLQPPFTQHAKPDGEYRNVMMQMKLGSIGSVPIQGGTQILFKLNENGKALSNLFIKSVESVGFSKDSFLSTTWNVSDLQTLCPGICLHELHKSSDERNRLEEGCRQACQKEEFFDDFKTHVLSIAQEYDKEEWLFSANAISEIALFRNNDEISNSIDIGDNDTTALLAYLELHAYFSLFAEGLLSFLLEASERGGELGVSISEIVGQSNRSLGNIMDGHYSSEDRLKDLINEIESKSDVITSLRIRKDPPYFGPVGLPTLAEELINLHESMDISYSIATAAVGLFLSSTIHDFFSSDWLEVVLPEHDQFFGPGLIRSKIISLPDKSTLADWIDIAIDIILTQNEDVVAAKGPYATRFDRVHDRMFFRKSAVTSYRLNKGRLNYAMQWFYDLGYLERIDALYSLREGWDQWFRS